MYRTTKKKKEFTIMKKALITGITGQDGSYLAELLLEKDTRYMASSAVPLFLQLRVLTTF